MEVDYQEPGLSPISTAKSLYLRCINWEDNYLPPEPISEPILVDDASPPPEPAPEPLDEPYPPPEASPESVLQDYEEVYDEEGALRDAEPITGSQAEIQIVEQEYQGSETAERYEKPPYEKEYPASFSGYYGNDVPKVIISHPVAPPKSRFKIKVCLILYLIEYSNPLE